MYCDVDVSDEVFMKFMGFHGLDEICEMRTLLKKLCYLFPFCLNS